MRIVARMADTPGHPGHAGWEAATCDNGNHVHVTPLADIVEHIQTDDADCTCGPTTQPVPRSDGSMGWLIVHHSLDGRERYET